MKIEEFETKIEAANSIDSLIELRKSIKSTRFISRIRSKIYNIAKNNGYIEKDISYSIARNFIGDGCVLARRQNFTPKSARFLSEFNGKKIQDAFINESSGFGSVKILILISPNC